MFATTPTTTTTTTTAVAAATCSAAPRHGVRRAAGVLAVLAVGASSALGAAGTATAATGHPATTVHTVHTVHTEAAAATPAQLAAQFLGLLNKKRTKSHLHALTAAPDLTKVATAWSAKMAGGVGLEHNPNLASQVKNWQVVGENVGDGTDVAALDRAFWMSPGHRANELYKTFTDVGIGVTVAKGTIWVTYDFRQR